jgi:hypothetical protein
MKIVTHKFKKINGEIIYLVNLIDDTGAPLESHTAVDADDKIKVSTLLAEKYNIPLVIHNVGFSIIA